MLWQSYLCSLILLLGLQPGVRVTVLSSQSASTFSDSPIRNWDSSWVASSSHGTSVAVSCRLSDTDCNGVLLLIRSSASGPSNLLWKPSLPPANHHQWKELKDGSSSLRILETPLDDFMVGSSSSSAFWTPIGTGAICAMTGLASDVDHAIRVVQNRLVAHRFVHDSTAFPVPVSGLAQWLSETVRSAAQYRAGRPYGLQALLIGRQPQNRLHVHSVDPSGAWRHWGGGGAAIGRHAQDVRQHLYDQLQTESAAVAGDHDAGLHPRRALQVALRAVLLAGRDASLDQEHDHYEGLLVWVDPTDTGGQCRVATVDPEAVKVCRDELWEALEMAKK